MAARGVRRRWFSLSLSIALVFSVALLSMVSTATAQDAETMLAAYLAAGEFGPAQQVARAADDPAVRDARLERIAQAQAQAGARRASLASVAEIEGDLLRTAALESLAATPLDARGGAAEADFEPLIDLITSTIAPTSWEDVGGVGAVAGFEGGVFVDAEGVLRPVVLAGGGTRLASLRAAAGSDSGNRQARVESDLRMVSLTRLERAVQLRRAAGHEATETMQTLAGLSKIEYVFVFPEQGEIVIAGPAGDWETNHEGRLVRSNGGRPVLRLDDLIVVLRSMTAEEPVFGCSITPYQDNLAQTQAFLTESAQRPLRPGARERERWLAELRDTLGRQAIEIYGIDPHSRAARVLVEADYHMKLLGMGLAETSADVTSYMDRVEQLGGVPEMKVLRWWFALNYECLATTPARDAFEIRGCGVRVLSENEMLTEQGERVHTGAAEMPNHEFAHDFTQHFDELAVEHPVYAELENVFDLALVAALMRAEDLPGQVDWHQSYFGDAALCPIEYDAVPAEVETVLAHRVVNRTEIIAGVSGGVRVDPAAYVTSEAIEQDTAGALDSHHDSAQPPVTLERDQWWWDP